MSLQLIPADLEQHRELLRNLWDFYLYEYSRFTRYRVSSEGRFPDPDVGYTFFRQPFRHSILLIVDQEIAGFAIVDVNIDSHFTGASNVIYMAEFFVLAGFQGLGIGEQAATRLFDQFRGSWEVYEMRDNTNAQHFWRKVIGRYMNGSYTETAYPEYEGIVQCFDNAR
ncbi:MAG: GNAT family N-acetyltransferase [Anaerolineae bacterium]|nr:GNAT family N-acetyltransferase [Anaerolineae bacterium]